MAKRVTADISEIRVVPANDAPWADIQELFGRRGPAAGCQCQRYKLAFRESFGSFPVEERAERLREQTNAGHPGDEPTSGLVAYAGDVPVGWCAVEPRSAYVGLARVYRVPWEGRDEDRTDPSVWALTCLFARQGHRRRGVGRALVTAAIDHARAHGARALEAYPIVTTSVLPEELHVGIEQVFIDAGFALVSRPTLRRSVVRIDFDETNRKDL
jgi:GNAT superfamily N-acetyltransferase